MKWLKKLFKRPKGETIEIKQLNTPNIRKRFCAKPFGYICLGDETDAKCGNCGHWI